MNTISSKATIGKNVSIGQNVIIEDNVIIGDNTYIDANTIVRSGTSIGSNSFIGANCIIGEYWMDFIKDHIYHEHPLFIGDGAIIRSGSIIYAGSNIGDNFNTGHQVTIREKAEIGDHVSVGTLSDIQGNCKIGHYVRMHSNVHVGQLSQIDSFVWIFPYAVLTNDPTPPSDQFVGVHIYPFAIVATSATLLPGVEINSDSLVAAGATVTKNVEKYAVVGGSPARQIGDVRNIKNHFSGQPAYPWREHFETYMPWKNTGYDSWYSNLTEEEKRKFGI